jgi:hypothetical protein
VNEAEKGRVIDTYAIPPDFKKVSTYAEAFGELLMKVPENKRSALKGASVGVPRSIQQCEGRRIGDSPRLKRAD